MKTDRRSQVGYRVWDRTGDTCIDYLKEKRGEGKRGKENSKRDCGKKNKERVKINRYDDIKTAGIE